MENEIKLGKYEKTAAIKDDILNKIREKEMVFSEIWAMYPDTTRTTFSGYMQSLRTFKLVQLVGEGKSTLNKKYVCISDKTFTEVLKEKIAEVNEKKKLINRVRPINSKPLLGGKIYKMEDFAGKSSRFDKGLNPWTGYTSFGETL